MPEQHRPQIIEKKHRLEREYYVGTVAVTFTAIICDHQKIFNNKAIIEAITPFLKIATVHYGCIVPIFCFMPEHLHVVFKGQNESSDTWKAMVEFKQHSGYWFGQQSQGAQWQKGFYDHIHRDDQDFYHQLVYIANNPVRRGLVDRWDAYSFTGSIGFDLISVLSAG